MEGRPLPAPSLSHTRQGPSLPREQRTDIVSSTTVGAAGGGHTGHNGAAWGSAVHAGPRDQRAVGCREQGRGLVGAGAPLHGPYEQKSHKVGSGPQFPHL